MSDAHVTDRPHRAAWAAVLGISAAACALLFWIIYFKPHPEGGEDTFLFLPGLNSLLNAASAVCLACGFVAIKRGWQDAHIRWMLSAFACSAVFLVCYILHHHLHGDTKFPGGHSLRGVYLLVLASHVLLSVVALPMILMTFYAGLTRSLTLHRRLARWTFPIWMYVSVTGVLVYLMLRAVGAHG